MEDTVPYLKKRIAELEAQLEQSKKTRPKIDVLDATVVDSNPYSRLMALKRMGVVSNYEAIRKFSVAIVGIGGVGSVSAEMLARCGIGKLLLYDYDKVELANMNRLFFRPEHTGMYKTDAAAQVIGFINPDVECVTYNFNMTHVRHFDEFCNGLKTGGIGGAPVDLVLGCVDNFEARMAINTACLELNLPWFESGVSEDAMGGHIQLIVPGATACFECAPPLIVASGIPESTLKREGVCAASLPTTMGVVSALLAQNALKYLLQFGQVSYYVGYQAMTDYFPSYRISANLECSNNWCKKRQSQYQESKPSGKDPLDFRKTNPESEVIHTDNEYEIVVLSSSEPKPSANSSLPDGLQYKFEANNNQDANVEPIAVESTQEKEGSTSSAKERLTLLRNKMKSLQ